MLMEPVFLISLIGTLLWLASLGAMSRSLRAGLALQRVSTGVFAALNVSVAAYPGLIGGALGAFLLVRAIRHAGLPSGPVSDHNGRASPRGARTVSGPDCADSGSVSRGRPRTPT